MEDLTIDQTHYPLTPSVLSWLRVFQIDARVGSSRSNVNRLKLERGWQFGVPLSGGPCTTDSASRRYSKQSSRRAALPVLSKIVTASAALFGSQTDCLAPRTATAFSPSFRHSQFPPVVHVRSVAVKSKHLLRSRRVHRADLLYQVRDQFPTPDTNAQGRWSIHILSVPGGAGA